MKYFASLLVLLYSCSAISASSFNGKLKGVMTGPNPLYDGIVFIKVDGQLTHTSNCHTNPHYDFTLDATTPGGKVTLSVVLSAFSAGKSVFIIGKGNNCSLYSGIEELDAVLVN